MLITFNLKYFDCFVGRTGCKSSAVIIKDSIVDHVVMTGVRDHLCHFGGVVVLFQLLIYPLSGHVSSELKSVLGTWQPWHCCWLSESSRLVWAGSEEGLPQNSRRGSEDRGIAFADDMCLALPPLPSSYIAFRAFWSSFSWECLVCVDSSQCPTHFAGLQTRSNSSNSRHNSTALSNRIVSPLDTLLPKASARQTPIPVF